MRLLAQALLRALMTLWMAVTIAFLLMRAIPGDAITTELRISGASAQQIAERRAALGLDRPLIVQYIVFLGGMTRGDLGISLTDGRSVGAILSDALPSTVGLAFVAFGGSIILGTILGSLAAGRGRLALLAYSIAIITTAIPVLLTATLAWVVAIALGLPLYLGTPSDPRAIFMPAVVLSLQGAGGIAIAVRVALRDVQSHAYIMTAYAKGLRQHLISRRHLLRPALPSILNAVALQAGFLLGGTAIIEIIFNRPGVGRLLLNAVIQGDSPVVIGVVIWSALVYVCIHTIADSAYALLDPRLRSG